MKTKDDHSKRLKSQKRGVRIVLWLLCMGVFVYAGLIGFVYYTETHVPPPSDYDSIIVLGAQVLPTGAPSVQLQWRLDKAAEMYNRHPCPVVVCGGQGSDEPAPEGLVMKEELIRQGIPAHMVFADVKSMNTDENLTFAAEILRELDCDKPLVVTSDYHLPRALSMVNDMGLHPQGAGSPSRKEFAFWARNHMREALAWLKYWGIKYLGLPL